MIRGNKAVMMFAVSMIQGISTDAQSQYDHSCFKSSIMNDIDAK